jgi:hypothetical protein
MKKSAIGKLVLAIALFALAAFCFIKFSPAGESKDETAYFYDLEEKKLFVAARDAIPPIPGIKNKDQAGVKAVVISTNGKPRDKASRKIAYLEKYSPDLKQRLEAVQAGKSTQVPPRGTRQAQIYVKRLEDAQWYAVDTAEGEKILNEWNVPGPNGVMPVVCSP